MNDEEIRLSSLLGLKPSLLQRWLERNEEEHLPWRVTTVDRGWCWLAGAGRVPTQSGTTEPPEIGSGATERAGWPAGTCFVRAASSLQHPLAVGDWVSLDVTGDPPRVTDVVERVSVLKRGAAGGASGEQLIAANLDVAFIVLALAENEKLEGRALNPRRVERYVAAVADGGATAVVVLNKVDLSERSRRRVDELRQRLRGVELIALSALTGEGTHELDAHLNPGESVALLGLSGVGKSTLVNRLLGREAQDTGEIRGVDAKGKHTTTRRQMFPTPSGAFLIDTPGMREFGFVSDGDGPAGFDDIAEWAERCRFSDCQHEGEPGCAVRKAIDDGELDADRLNNFRALEREDLRMRARHDAYARHLQHKEFRKFGRVVQDAQKRKRR